MNKNKSSDNDISEKEVYSLVEKLKYYQIKIDLIWIKLNKYRK